MATIKNKKQQQKITSAGWDVEKLEPCALLVGMKNGAAAMENSMAVPQKLKIELSYEPTVPLLSITPNN